MKLPVILFICDCMSRQFKVIRMSMSWSAQTRPRLNDASELSSWDSGWDWDWVSMFSDLWQMTRVRGQLNIWQTCSCRRGITSPSSRSVTPDLHIHLRHQTISSDVQWVVGGGGHFTLWLNLRERAREAVWTCHRCIYCEHVNNIMLTENMMLCLQMREDWSAVGVICVHICNQWHSSVCKNTLKCELKAPSHNPPTLPPH